MTVNDCIKELSSIINELDDIKSGIKRDFSGIGEQYCCDCINGVINKYRGVKRDLENIDPGKKDDWEG